MNDFQQRLQQAVKVDVDPDIAGIRAVGHARARRHAMVVRSVAALVIIAGLGLAVAAVGRGQSAQTTFMEVDAAIGPVSAGPDDADTYDADGLADANTSGDGTGDGGSIVESPSVGPDIGEHWHAAYAVAECGEVWPIFLDETSPHGIHTHGDGLIHIHPVDAAATGEAATFRSFLDIQGVDLDAWESIICDGQPSETVLVRRGDAAPATTETFTGDDIDTAFFERDRELWVLARIPAGGEIPDVPADRIGMLDIVTGVG